MAFHGADQVGQEQKGALEDADKVQLARRRILANLPGEVGNAGGEFFLIDQDGGLGSRHGGKD